MDQQANTIKYLKALQNIAPLLPNLTVSHKEDEDDPKTFYNLDIQNVSLELIAIVNKFAEYYDLPLEIKLLLLMVKNKEDKVEFTNCSFKFFSANEIKDRHHNFTRDNQTRWIDLGMVYSGMGYWHALSWDKVTKKAFIRLDGGSSGHDRHYNREFYFGSSSKQARFTINTSDKQLYNINDILQVIQQPIEDNYYMVTN